MVVHCDELLQRCILANRHFTLRAAQAPSRILGAAGGLPAGEHAKPSVTYDFGQILLDIEDTYLKNRSRIGYMVRTFPFL